MIPRLIIMATWIPIVWGQSSSVASLTSIVSSAARPVSSSVSAAVPATSSSVVTPRLAFDRIDTLVACSSAEVSWAITGLRSEVYEVSLFAIDANATTSSSSSASVARPASSARAAATSISARPVAVASSSRLATSSALLTTPRVLSSSSAARSTILVGRNLHSRQSQDFSNVTIATEHNAAEPYTFTVTLPSGSYYMVASINDPLRTTARSNLFTVIERDDTSCLPAGGSGGSSSVSQSTTIGGVMQTPGAGSSESSTSSGPSGGAIAGIVIGVLGGLAILAFLAFFCIRKKRRQQGGKFSNREMGERGPDDRFSALPSASSEDGQYVPGALPIAAGYRRDSDTDEKDVEPGSGGPYGTTTTLARNQPFPNHNLGPGGPTTTESPWSGTTHTSTGEQEVLASPQYPPALGDRRRQSGPPVEVEHTLVPKTSMQGIIGKATSSNESSVNHSRSSSTGGVTSSTLPPVSGSGAAATAAAGGAAGTGAGVSRSTSTKRKPVPSLGPELRGELQRERERKLSQSSTRKPSVGGGGGGGGGQSGEGRRSYILTADPLPPSSH